MTVELMLSLSLSLSHPSERKRDREVERERERERERTLAQQPKYSDSGWADNQVNYKIIATVELMFDDSLSLPSI